MQPSSKQAARLITLAWGDRYFEQLRDLTLPALLAPGNLPALVAHFDCTLVIVTETRLFETFRAADVIRKIEAYCPVRLVSIDNLIDGVVGYGLALTYALHRGFDDLAERMCDTFLIFFNADFIIADGSLATLAKHMLAGERLIFSPSYCVEAEAATPILEKLVDPATGVLAIPKRDLAAIILDHLHNTVRAKIVNQQFFSMHVSDQMYWRVDRHTLLGHQLPIAIVCMRPERVYTQPICFWDYATISMACPTANRCVLGDSDEFLMLELRERDTFRELMKLSVPTPEEVGQKLGEYMTADQIEMGRYPLTLHAHDLPAGTGRARTKLTTYVDRVYRALPLEPVSPVNHRFWVGQAEHYDAQRKHSEEQRAMAVYRQRLVELSRDTPADPGSGPWPEIEVRIKGSAPSLSPGRLLVGGLFGFVPDVTALHPYYGQYRFVADCVKRALADKTLPNSFFLGNEGSALDRLLARRPGTYTRSTVAALFRHNIPAAAQTFDFCLCDLDWPEVNEFPRIYRLIKPRMKPGGTFVVFHSSRTIRQIDPVGGVMAVRPLIPDEAGAVFYFSGGPDVTTAFDNYRTWLLDNAAAPDLQRNAIRKLVRQARTTLRINRADRMRSPHALAVPCIGFTMEISSADD